MAMLLFSISVLTMAMLLSSISALTCIGDNWKLSLGIGIEEGTVPMMVLAGTEIAGTGPTVCSSALLLSCSKARGLVGKNLQSFRESVT